MFFKIFIESILQAFGQIWGNKLRSFLTLLGIIIGIWCVITVLAAVDSLETNIRGSFEKLGDDVVYVQKFPWGDGNSIDWAKILKRPDPDFDDYNAIKKRVKIADKIAYSSFIGQVPAQYRSNNVEQAFVIGVSYDYGDVFNMELDQGRYFSPTEHFYGGNQVVLGFKVAEELFGTTINPINKYIKVKGRKYQVIGVIKKEGNDLVNPIEFDEVVILSINNTRRFSSVNWGAMIAVKAQKDVSLDQLTDELTMVMRSKHRLKPNQEDDFSLNQLSIISNVFDSVFGVLNVVGWIIGGFSMVVGMVSVANIMFVSVKERTRQIGIKKALGAKKYMILIEFLIESIVLCLIGGVIGLIFVYLTTAVASQAIEFKFFLSQENIIIGCTVSMITGIIAGIIPAIMGANMVPVEAMRK
ncbi:MAG: ABC transporter permease [Saprospiraceae bacterium]